MEIIGIVCEYNPFHNGHLYHIEKIKEMYPDSLIVLVMSGYFTERGEISIISKYNKTRIALKFGVDIVLEFPTLYSTNSADIFAGRSIKILSKLGVKKIIFGSESNDKEKLYNLAHSQLNDSNFDEKVKKELSLGSNYPTALAKALGTNLESNDLLGIAYIKAILEKDYDIDAIPIKRTNDFNDLESTESIVSAGNIRNRLMNNEDITPYIPNYDLSYINKIDYEKLFLLLKYKIITSNNLDAYLGVDEGLSNRLKKCIDDSKNIEELLENLKSKRYTTARLKRMLIHILLGITKEDIKISIETVRILGFNSRGQEYLNSLDTSNFIYKEESRVHDIELRAATIYNELTNDFSTDEELYNKPVITI